MPLGTISSRASEYHAERYGNDRLTEPDLVSAEVVTLRPDSILAGDTREGCIVQHMAGMR